MSLWDNLNNFVESLFTMGIIIEDKEYKKVEVVEQVIENVPTTYPYYVSFIDARGN
jgi:hypothetical protein